VRSVSGAFQRTVFAQEVNDDYIPLVTVSWNDPVVGSGTLRFARAPEDVTSRASTYTAWAFEMELGSQTDHEVPTARLVFDNVDRVLVQQLETLNTPATVVLEVVLDSARDDVEVSLEGTVRFVNYDARTIELEIEVLPRFANRSFCGYRFRTSDGFNAIRP